MVRFANLSPPPRIQPYSRFYRFQAKIQSIIASENYPRFYFLATAIFDNVLNWKNISGFLKLFGKQVGYSAIEKAINQTLFFLNTTMALSVDNWKFEMYTITSIN